jgi:hydrogenase maturation factor HypF (carbamoyltransferase family)
MGIRTVSRSNLSKRDEAAKSGLQLPAVGVCRDCLEDTTSPFSRRYRYPYTACNICGPKISVTVNSTKTVQPIERMCFDCKQEFSDPNSRRFQFAHNSCHACGSKTLLARTDGRVVCIDSLSQLDDVDAATSLLQKGEILTFKDSMGYFLACDATNEEAVSALRKAKQNYEKPFAVIARDLSIIEQHCQISPQERELLLDEDTSLIILERKKTDASTQNISNAPIKNISKSVAPNLNTLAFGLPETALMHLLLKRMSRPIIVTPASLPGQSIYVLSNSNKNNEPAPEQTRRTLLRTTNLSDSVQTIKFRAERGARKIMLTADAEQIQQHHAHIVSCLVDNNWEPAAGPVLGVALGGISPGDDGTHWGGEFLLSDYIGYNRFATFKPVPLYDDRWLERKSWLCLYAHLMAEMGWARYQMDFEELELTAFFESQSLPTINEILNDKERSPLASSCTALFDAMIAAIGINRGRNQW